LGVRRHKWQLQNIHSSLKTLPANRTLLDDLKLLRQLGLVASGGRQCLERAAGALDWCSAQGLELWQIAPRDGTSTGRARGHSSFRRDLACVKRGVSAHGQATSRLNAPAKALNGYRFGERTREALELACLRMKYTSRFWGASIPTCDRSESRICRYGALSYWRARRCQPTADAPPCCCSVVSDTMRSCTEE
jgi:hypothetical protein